LLRKGGIERGSRKNCSYKRKRGRVHLAFIAGIYSGKKGPRLDPIGSTGGAAWGRGERRAEAISRGRKRGESVAPWHV